jgi:uncharacterized membrane protein YedE/YeeE
MNKSVIALIAGLLFGIGLLMSGMASPAKVLGFLSLGPGWDPSLMLVMGGGLGVSMPGFWWMRRRGKPALADAFSEPATQRIDARLLIGAAIFGLGWGLSGLCPGPVIVGVALLQPAALLFLPAMLIGAAAASVLTAIKAR